MNKISISMAVPDYSHVRDVRIGAVNPFIHAFSTVSRGTEWFEMIIIHVSMR